MSKEIVFVTSKLAGGGAEKVIFRLSNEMIAQGHHVSIVTVNSEKEVNLSGLCKQVSLFSLNNHGAQMTEEPLTHRVCGIAVRLICRVFERLHKRVPDRIAEAAFQSVYGRQVAVLRDYLIERPQASVIAFLRPSTNIALLAAKELPNRLIVSERSDPNRLLMDRYGRAFLKKHYPRADYMVFQTPDSKEFFDKMARRPGEVIPNPIDDSIPEPFHGKRKRQVVNFCRFSPEKNIPLLIRAFSHFAEEHPDFSLVIYGDLQNGEAQATIKEIQKCIDESKQVDKIELRPFEKEILKTVRDCTMFVSSSDWEGMSNSMLEAMAVGLPTVCTDCPAGGARMIIRDHENGLLVPMGDEQRLCAAMKEIAEKPELAKQLSLNGTKLRDELSVKVITKRWLNVL